MKREKGTLGANPIKFTGMGHNGIPALDGKDTAYYLKKAIAQNIAYSAYHEAKTIAEIAEELGVAEAFIEDEVAYLEEYGFMDKTSDGKYLTNICINIPSKDALEEQHKIYTKYSKIVRDKYIPLVFDAMSDYKSKDIYVPKDDFNFLMWLAVSYSCGKNLWVVGESGNIDISKYNVKRKDGGQYIAHASMAAKEPFELSFDSSLYGVCGEMTRDGGGVFAWQIDTYYDSRKGGWQDNYYTDYEYLYEFFTGKLTKETENIEKYKRLIDKGYLIKNDDGSEYVNMICALSHDKFNDMLPKIPEELKPLSRELDAELLKINKTQYPPHMQDLCRSWSNGSLSGNGIRMRVVEQLAADGTLKPLSDVQKCSVNTILFCDILPK